MSAVPQGGGWRQASDGNWYPPSSVPGRPAPPPVPPTVPVVVEAVPCPRCGHLQSVTKHACENCGQVHRLAVGVVLTSAGRRLGQYALDCLLFLVTLIIGYIVWSLIVWSRGQTPAMQLLHITTVKLDTRRTAPWGTMCLREVVGKDLIMGAIAAILWPAWVALCFMVVWDHDSQALWDKVAGTIVVDDPEATASPVTAAPAYWQSWPTG